MLTATALCDVLVRDLFDRLGRRRSCSPCAAGVMGGAGPDL